MPDALPETAERYQVRAVTECMGRPCVPTYWIEGKGGFRAYVDNATDAKFLLSILNSATPEQIETANKKALENV